MSTRCSAMGSLPDYNRPDGLAAHKARRQYETIREAIMSSRQPAGLRQEGDIPGTRSGPMDKSRRWPGRHVIRNPDIHPLTLTIRTRGM